jgi:hypothetical protein
MHENRNANWSITFIMYRAWFFTFNTSIMRVNGNANDHSCSIFQDFKLPNHDIYQALPLIDVLIYRKFL